MINFKRLFCNFTYYTITVPLRFMMQLFKTTRKKFVEDMISDLESPVSDREKNRLLIHWLDRGWIRSREELKKAQKLISSKQ